MKRVLKLMLPPVLAIMLVVGYGSGTIQTIAKTITTMVPTVVEVTTINTIEVTTNTSMSGWEYFAVPSGSPYWRTVTMVNSVVSRYTTLVPTEIEVSDKTVPDEKPRSNYDRFQDKISKIIADAEKQIQTDSNAANSASDPIVLDTGEWVSFKGDVYQKLQDSGRPIQITFRYKGKHWRVDIPAGADLMSLVDENGYCGFMNLVAHFGGTELED